MVYSITRTTIGSRLRRSLAAYSRDRQDPSERTWSTGSLGAVLPHLARHTNSAPVAPAVRHNSKPTNNRSASSSTPAKAPSPTSPNSRPASVCSPVAYDPIAALMVAWVPHSTSPTTRPCGNAPVPSPRPLLARPNAASLASILGAVIELRYRRAGVDCEVRTRRYPRFRPPDLRGSSARRPRWASHCLAAPHDVRRTVSGAPASRSCGNPSGTTRRDSAGGRRQPKPFVELARLRSRRQVEAADAIDGDVPGHGTFQLLRRPSDDTPGGLPRIEVSA